jgi:hypothetical protein
MPLCEESKEKRRNELTLTARLGRPDKADLCSARPAVARVCLHIGFCTLLDSTAQGVQVPPSEFLFLISIFQAMALAMCVDESLRCLFAIMRVDAI